MAIQNVYNNQSFITAKALKQVKNNLVMVSRVARRWDGDFASSFSSQGGGPDSGKIGTTLNIRSPWFPTLRSGPAAAPSAYGDYYTAVPLLQLGVDYEVTVADQTLNVDEFYTNVADPMAKTLYQNMDYVCWTAINPGSQGSGFNQFEGKPGTALANTQNIMDAYAVMQTQASVFTDDKISVALNPHTNANVWQGITTLFNPQSDASNRWRNGSIGHVAGIDYCTTANAQSLTLGTWSGTILYSSGATDGGNTIVVSGMTGTFNPGEHFTINGVSAVTPMGKAVQSELKHFTVISQVGTTITFSPAFHVTGPLQNINALPTGSANLNPWGFSTATELSAGTGQIARESLVFHEEAIAFCMADLIETSNLGGVAGGNKFSGRMKDPETGLRCSTLFWLDGYNHKLLFRLDALYNAVPLRQGFATIVVE
jgi:hypothetical protein